MKRLLPLGIAVLLSLPSFGCIVRSRTNSHSHGVSRRDCPPAYHWNGAQCVHNGRGHAKGHHKHGKHR